MPLSEQLGDDVIARLNPATDEVENLEILFFSTRLLRSVAADRSEVAVISPFIARIGDVVLAMLLRRQPHVAPRPTSQLRNSAIFC